MSESHGSPANVTKLLLGSITAGTGVCAGSAKLAKKQDGFLPMQSTPVLPILLFLPHQ